MPNDDYPALPIDWPFIIIAGAIILAGQLCSGCAAHRYVTDSGIRVSADSSVAWTPGEILGTYVDFTITHWEEYFRQDIPVTRLALQHLNVEFTCDYLERTEDGRLITGWQWGNNIRLSTLTDKPDYCIADSSLTHELAHWILWLTQGDPDGKHRRDTIWGPIDGWVVTSRGLARKHFCKEK